MLPAAGIISAERLYIGIKINSITDETASEYANSNNGAFNIDIIDGRNKGFIIQCNTATVYSTNGLSISYTGFDGIGDYAISIFDNASKVINNAIVHIGYDGSGSYITYNGVNYTTGQSFHFLNHH